MTIKYEPEFLGHLHAKGTAVCIEKNNERSPNKDSAPENRCVLVVPFYNQRGVLEAEPIIRAIERVRTECTYTKVWLMNPTYGFKLVERLVWHQWILRVRAEIKELEKFRVKYN